MSIRGIRQPIPPRTLLGNVGHTTAQPVPISIQELAAASRGAIGTGSVVSVDVSGGSTGLTTSGGPIVTTGTITLAGTLNAAHGGTGQTVYAVGDILFASTTTALSKLADVATGNALISGGVGTAPAWGKIGLTTHVSGTLAIGNGGTGNTTGTATVNANLTGPITSVGNATSIASQTGTGTKFVVDNTPTLVTPVLGVASATSINFGQTALSYYGEGTWTPTDQSGAGLSLTINNATYTKIGRFVFARHYINYPVTANASQATIGGLPFTIANYGTAALDTSSSLTGVYAQLSVSSTLYQVFFSARSSVTNAQLSSAFLISSLTYEA